MYLQPTVNHQSWWKFGHVFTHLWSLLGASIVQQGHPTAVDLCISIVAHSSKLVTFAVNHIHVQWSKQSNSRWGLDSATESPNLIWISCKQCYSAPLTILALPTHDLITLRIPISGMPRWYHTDAHACASASTGVAQYIHVAREGGRWGGFGIWLP